MKVKAIALLLSSISSAYAATNTIEVSAFYNEEASYNKSIAVVGFYRGLEHVNALFAEKGVDVAFVPTHVGTFDSSEMEPDIGVFNGRAGMSGTSSTAALKSMVGDMAVGLFNNQASIYGNSEGVVDFTYTDSPNQTRKIGVTTTLGLGVDQFNSARYVLGHEMIHAFGVGHTSERAQLFNTTGESRTDGYSNVCDNGEQSLMGEDVLYVDFETISIAGASDCNTGGGNVVDFINTFAPQVANIQAARENQTLSLEIEENINTQAFEILVTRTEIGSGQTATIYIAGGNGDTGIGLEPISIEFGESDYEAQTVVYFDDIHPIFENANDSVSSTYVVAVTDTEVVSQSLDLLDYNSAWELETLDETDNAASEVASSGNSSGGSLGIGLFALLMISLRRTYLNK